jgi:hypothetical protein
MMVQCFMLYPFRSAEVACPPLADCGKLSRSASQVAVQNERESLQTIEKIPFMVTVPEHILRFLSSLPD